MFRIALLLQGISYLWGNCIIIIGKARKVKLNENSIFCTCSGFMLYPVAEVGADEIPGDRIQGFLPKTKNQENYAYINNTNK